MCTTECNSTQNVTISNYQLQLVSSVPWRMHLTFAIAQIFVWPFVYINILMLFTFYRKQSFRTETRYILFAHTLLTDVIFLVLTDFVVIFSHSYVLLPTAFCIPFCMLMDAVTSCTPLTITAMCVERYVAICMPLRHSAISTTSRTLTAILIIWIISYIKPFVDVFILVATVSEEYFLEPTFCHYEIMMPEQWHRLMRSILYVTDFIIILLIELFCYLMIVLAARAASVDKKSAGKGLRTISLHMLQLMLCTFEIVCPYIEAMVIQIDIQLYLSVRSFNFFTFNVIARAVSTLVYGLGDEKFCTAMLYYVRCKQNYILSENKAPNT
ncbi:odorant receptor 131-2-like [Pygocentrus nattereri]|uniref:odorant receptor 131-2-like n=1 Tax=Pygocentrus nattereri TaxID=42514 RepID=UPI001890BF7B|nr:odorant receptor 131-2-like [Pygocentrus nattereri]